MISSGTIKENIGGKKLCQYIDLPLPILSLRKHRLPAKTVNSQGGGTTPAFSPHQFTQGCNLSNESKCIVCRDAPLEFKLALVLLELPSCPHEPKDFPCKNCSSLQPTKFDPCTYYIPN